MYIRGSARTVPRGLAKKCSGAATRAGARALQLVRKGLNSMDGRMFEQHFDVESLCEATSSKEVETPKVGQ